MKLVDPIYLKFFKFQNMLYPIKLNKTIIIKNRKLIASSSYDKSYTPLKQKNCYNYVYSLRA